LQLERQIALQEYVNDAVDLERQLKQNLLSTQEYNLKLKAAELNLTKELYSLENAAADERQRRAREAEQEAKSVAKEQERLVQNILGLQAELLQAGLAGADIDVEGTRVREGQAAALQLELDQLQQKLEYEARVIDLQLQQKLASSEISVQERTLLESIYREQIKNLEAQYQVRKLTLQQAQAQLALEKFISAEQSKAQAAAPFEQFRRDQELDAQYAKTYYRLLVEGIKPAEAERFANFERLVAEQLILLDQQIALTSAAVAQAEAYGASADEIIRLRTELENLNKARGAVTEQAALGPGPAVEEIPGAKIQEFISTAGQELKDLESVAIRVSQGIGDAVGNSLTNGINGLIEGTATAKEVFANFLNDVAGILMQESAKMIATYIAIGIARQFAGFFGGGSNADPLKGVGGADWMKYTTPNANGNMYTSNGIVPFANGGMFTNSIVSSPTLFKFADGGVSQMGLMGEAGPEAIMPLKRGPGGRLGVDASGSGGDNIAVTVNVDAKGSSVQGDDQRGNQLGRAISAAVQQELIKQKRPGGLLS
jgi:hypothetical protein